VTASEIEFADGSQLLAEAYEVAVHAHADQLEETDGQPYIDHPVTVARLLFEAGFDEEVVAAGLLHDTIERSDLTVDDIRPRFGDRVADLVGAMTEPATIESFEDRKAELRMQVARAGRDAEAIFAADKIAKSSSLRRALAQLGESEVSRRAGSPLKQKIEHYHASLELLDTLAADLPFVPQLHSELDALEEQRIHDGDFELARRAIDAINRRDPEALIDVCDPEVEWWPALTLGVGGGPYHGYDGLRRYIADLTAAWDPFEISIQETRATGARLLVICTIRGCGRRSRVRLERRAAIIYRVRAGRVIGAKTLLDYDPVTVTAP
jgi:ketosteroid isomerase-like protein